MRHREHPPLRATICSVTLAAATAGCGDSTGPGADGRRLALSATGLVLAPGDTAALGLTRFQARGAVEQTRAARGQSNWPADLAIAWRTDAPAVATIDADGLVTARGPGRTTLWAEAGGLRDSATVRVVAVAEPARGLPAARFAALAAGGATCALDDGGRAWCWGSMWLGEAGTGVVRRFTGQASPALVAGAPRFTRLSAGPTHACGVAADGAVYCWGDNAFGQLGDGTRDTRPAAVRASALGGTRAQAVAAGGLETCALAAGGAEVVCWGTGEGRSTGARRYAAPAGLTFTAITAGISSHRCTLDGAGRAYCWGDNGSGALGTGNAASQAAPTAVVGGLRFTSISAGAGFTCGVTTDEAAYCWGWGAQGRLGTGSQASAASLAPVAGGLRMRQLDAGTEHACAVTTDGAAYCWGNHLDGALGIGRPPQAEPSAADLIRPTPQRVAGGRTFVEVAVGGPSPHGCARQADSATFCWGGNGAGQLGIGKLGWAAGWGTRPIRWEPTAVAAPE